LRRQSLTATRTPTTSAKESSAEAGTISSLLLFLLPWQLR